MALAKNKKIKLAVLAGGQSAEYEVSLQSSKNIVKALDKDRYEVYVILITTTGAWYLFDSWELFADLEEHDQYLESKHCQRITPAFGDADRNIVTLAKKPTSLKIDVFFPAIHGPNCEDGTMQGLLELLDAPFVGPGVLASAACMDKDVCKRLMRAANIPTSNWISLTKHEATQINFELIESQLGLPMFVKPANIGSSIGISKVKNREAFYAAIDVALQYDKKIILEECIVGQEVECSVLGNDEPRASLPGEIVAHHDFYSYEAKYIDPDGATLVVPAQLSPEVVEKVQNYAVKAFAALECEGMARIDFFVTQDDEIFVNEINTLPGFTDISMYPKTWAVSGVSYAALLDELIAFAIERYDYNKGLKTAKYYAKSQASNT